MSLSREEYESLLSRALSNFSDRDYKTLMDETLARVSNIFDKRDGSMIYNAVAALMFEVSMLYGALDFVIGATYIDSAPREYLIKRAADRSIVPNPATHAVFYAYFERQNGLVVPIGTRFNCEDLNFAVVAYKDGEMAYNKTFVELNDNDELVEVTRVVQLVQCETPGTVANSYSGNLIPVDYVDGLQVARIQEIHTPAVDEEETEHFRARVKEAMRSIAFGGNIADYKQKVLALDGVGQVKVHPIWDGPGTVKLVIAGTDNENPAVDALLEDLKREIDPDGNEGEGYGLAPIGHTVTIESAEELPVDVELEVTGTGEDVSAEVEEVLREYFSNLTAKWSATGEEGLKVLFSTVMQRVLDDERCASAIRSIEEVQLNDSGVNHHLTLLPDQVPVLGTVTITTSNG